jgi:hypothetical protein
MRHLTVRGIDRELEMALQEEKQQRGTSLNETVKSLLRLALGLSSPVRDNGLGRHAGGWSDRDLEEFDRNTTQFDQIDEELWR